MTIEEICAELKIKPSYLKSHFNEVADRYVNYNIELFKIGRGDKASYGIRAFPRTLNEPIRWEHDPNFGGLGK